MNTIENSTSSFNGKLVAFVISLFLIVFPFAIAFPDVFDDSSQMDRVQNWTLFICTLLFLGSYRRGFNIRILAIHILLLFVYIINYMFAYFSNTSWLLNSFAFLSFSLMFSHIFLNCNEVLIRRLDHYVNFLVLSISFALIIMFYWGAIFIPDYFNLSYERNIIINEFNAKFGLYKQTFGYLFSLIIIWNFVYWGVMSPRRKAVFIVLAFAATPIFLGIRTSILGLCLLFLLINIGKNYLTFALVLSSLLMIWPSVIYSDDLMILIELFYDRLPSVKFGFDQLSSFGVGNGGYHFYAAEFSDALFNKYASGIMLLHGGFWVAPESDLAYFMASFGFLSIVFLMLYLYIINNGLKAIDYYKIRGYRIFVVILLYFILLIFEGISEDYAGHAGWWIYLSASIGLVSRLNLRNKV